MPTIRVRARALDMLGRQQMAGIPNALHELFKNAHDAYADRVDVDYYRATGLLVLRDDGVGMTRDDFESRWLTLGTESKVPHGGMKPPYKDPHKPARIMLGEKGIGRLAVATVGPQVFVLSRAERETGLQDFVTAFINWTFFEVPGLGLDDIDIPVNSVQRFALVHEGKGTGKLEDAVKHYENLLVVLGNKIPEAFQDRIRDELSSFRNAIPAITGAIHELLDASHRGTAFFVQPVDPILEKDIDEIADDLPSKLTKMLRGFSNTMVQGETPPPLTATFRDHGRDGTAVELIGADLFFTPQEFTQADHHFEGWFDEFGQFSGTVQIYRGEPKNYSVPWDGSHGVPTACGAFRIKVGYVQGKEKESLLPKENYEILVNKLNAYGGLYVYKNGVRVLPYGNSDIDFLNIERRRTKSASDWFFSYRRVFGAIELSHPENQELREKAGREGFRENKAYRQFQGILENFFKTLAMDWFREETTKYGAFKEQRSEIERQNKLQAKLLEKREKGAKLKRERLSKVLDAFYTDIEKQTPEQTISSAREQLSAKLACIAELGPEDAARELLKLETELRTELDALRKRFRITKPRGVGLTKRLHQDWARSVTISQRLVEELFSPFEREIDERVTASIGETRALVDRRRRLVELIRANEQRDVGRAKALAKETRETAGILGKEILERARTGLASVDEAFKAAQSELERNDLAALDDQGAVEFRTAVESRLKRTVAERMGSLEALTDQIQAVLDSLKDGTSLDETAAALEERNKILEEQVEFFGELAQIGAALGVVQHEFNSTVNGVNRGIHDLKQYVNLKPELKNTYESLRNTFAHLNTYLSIFLPLDRRRYSGTIEMSGKEIRGYFLQFFSERFKRHNVELRATPAFLVHTVQGLPSTFLPPFINLLDNALYWLVRDSAGNTLPDDGGRKIILDADDKGFLISNTGPGIEERDAERIFEFAFTRKLRGRGMGLAISRKALRDAGFELTLEAVGSHTTPMFRIRTEKKKNVEP
jgi:signal transduction histidine kinase